MKGSFNFDIGSGAFGKMEETEVPDDVNSTKRTKNLGACDEWGLVCERCPLPDGCVKVDYNNKPIESQCPIDVAYHWGWKTVEVVLLHGPTLGLLKMCECGRAIDNGRCYYCEPEIKRP